jgi:Ankyrin repeats (3 copies)/Ankyrin repeat
MVCICRWGDLRRCCGRGRLALHYAASGGHLEVVRELLDAGLCLLSQLPVCSGACHHRLKYVCMHNTGHEVKDTADRNGMTPLMLAAANGHASIVELLLKRWADKNLKDSSGATAAHHAAKDMQQDCLDILLDAGSDLLAANCMGQLLIHLAAINGSVEMVDSLLSRGSHVNGCMFLATYVAASIRKHTCRS